MVGGIALFQQTTDIAPLFSVGNQISCVFGRGIIRAIRKDGVYCCEITSWRLANGATPTAFLQADALQPISEQMFAVGEVVSTAYGQGTVTKVRWDGVYEVKPVAWKLANFCTPVFYLQVCFPRPIKQ